MKKLILILTAVLCLIPQSKSQTYIDTVSMGPGYSNQAYYDISTGKYKAAPVASWHFAHTSNTRDNCIRFNHTAGVNVYLYPKGDMKDYLNFDTTGWRTWVRPMNDNHKHEMGAINKQVDPNNMWDFSWGVYDAGSHKVKGDSLYLITIGENTQNPKFFKFLPISQEPNGDLVFQFDMVENTFPVPDTLKQSKFDGATYKYYNFDTKKQVLVEPSNAAWNLNFCRYYVPTFDGSKFVPYLTAGVETKRGIQSVKIAKTTWESFIENAKTHVSDSKTDTVGGKGFRNDLTRIGSDWKTFNGSAFVIYDSVNYIVEIPNATGADYWGMRFKKFAGAASGDVVLERTKLLTLSETEYLNSANVNVYPVPAQNELFINLDEKLQANTIVIRSIDGRIMLSQNVEVSDNNIISVKMDAIPTGNYLLEVYHNQGKVAKIISKN